MLCTGGADVIGADAHEAQGVVPLDLLAGLGLGLALGLGLGLGLRLGLRLGLELGLGLGLGLPCRVSRSHRRPGGTRRRRGPRESG
jgi:hypothetical protein